MTIVEDFIHVASTYDLKKPPKQSSLIKPWLGKTSIPQSVSIKVGNILEDFFAYSMGTQNKLSLTDYKTGRNYMITYDGEDHQIDMLAMPSDWEKFKKYLHREMKLNTDLDRGKKRDTLAREEAICAWMQSQGWEYDSGIFCPFFYNKGKKVAGLGWVDGIDWYIETFEPSWTKEDFIAMGKSPEIHSVLCL